MSLLLGVCNNVNAMITLVFCRENLYFVATCKTWNIVAYTLHHFKIYWNKHN